jgi:murein DD-endopeptidase MepM/ murein hydrolase activator NlpD
LRIHPLLFTFALALAGVVSPGAADAQTPGVSDDEPATFSASQPAVVTPAAEPAAVPVLLAPVAMDNVYLGEAVPAGGFAEITPPAPKVLASVGRAYAGRAAGSGALQVNSGFGMRRDPFTGAARMHTGVDLRADYGESVGASLGGTVIYASYRGGYGNLVIVDHGRGIATMYGHLSSIAVSTGQRVVGGQTIGYVGSTGRSTGPHLHYEVRARGHALDPASVITFKGKSIFANGRLVDGPTIEGGDEETASATAKPGKPAPPPLPLFQSADGLSNY